MPMFVLAERRFCKYDPSQRGLNMQVIEHHPVSVVVLSGARHN